MLWNDEFLPKSSTTMTTMCGFLSLESGVKKKRARKVNPAAAFIFESNCRILLRLYQGSFRKSISWDIDIFNRAITSVESPTFFIGSENQKKYDFKKCLDIFIGEKIRLNSQYSFANQISIMFYHKFHLGKRQESYIGIGLAHNCRGQLLKSERFVWKTSVCMDVKGETERRQVSGFEMPALHLMSEDSTFSTYSLCICATHQGVKNFISTINPRLS